METNSFSPTQQYMFYFYFHIDSMFGSVDHHQVIFTKVKRYIYSANSIHVMWDPIKIINWKNTKIL